MIQSKLTCLNGNDIHLTFLKCHIFFITVNDACPTAKRKAPKMYEEKSARITQFSFQQLFCRRQVAKTRLSIELPVGRQSSNVRKINCQLSKTQYWEKLNIEKSDFYFLQLEPELCFPTQ